MLNINSFLVNDIIYFFLNKFLPAILIFSLFYISAKLIPKLILKLTTKFTKSHQPIFILFSQTAKITLITIGSISALGNMGVNITALIAGFGLTGVGLGLALKDSISNILAGILVLIYQPFKIQDQITILHTTGKEVSGRIINIDLRYLTLDTEDKKILIPNGSIFSSVISIKKL